MAIVFREGRTQEITHRLGKNKQTQMRTQRPPIPWCTNETRFPNKWQNTAWPAHVDMKLHLSKTLPVLYQWRDRRLYAPTLYTRSCVSKTRNDRGEKPRIGTKCHHGKWREIRQLIFRTTKENKENSPPAPWPATQPDKWIYPLFAQNKRNLMRTQKSKKRTQCSLPGPPWYVHCGRVQCSVPREFPRNEM